MKNKVIYFLALTAALLLLSSCGVRRNNIVARKFHSTTSLFNYLYNGEVVWKDGVKQINAAYRIPPEGYIPVWYAGTEEDAKTYGSNFESAIEKCEIALQKHNQKDNKWFDDLRFLIGRSWFYKRNYILAIKNFEYVIKTYPDSKLIPDVYLWMVKTHYMDGNSTLALKLIEEKLTKLELTKRQQGELALVKAQALLDEGNYEEVVRTLNASRKLIKGSNNKARMHFLLGQIYQDEGKTSRAFENYKRVTRLNTDYELIFNAKLNLAKLLISEQEGSASNPKLRRLLKKMLRDEKNVDYKDRIYYEMAMLDLKVGNQPEAIEHLKLSIASNTSNQRQKALSYYKIGQIYFYELKDFPHAQAYFDSASTAITRDAPEYREISTISATLKEYIGYVNTIHLQDSLLALSRMSDNELGAYVDQVLEDKKRRDEEAAQRQLEELNQLNDPNLFNQFGEDKNRKTGEFYFDSPDLVNSGRVEFEQVWGSRKNEDNWRRKNKVLQVGDEDAGEEAVVEVSKEDVEKYGSKEKAAMIKAVPRTAADKQAANDKVLEAMYGLGQIYNNKLNIQDSAIAVYERLIDRFPDSEYALKSRYALFKIHKDKGNEDIAKDYERQICNAAPNSRYCKFCRGEQFEEEDKSMFEDFASAYKALLETYGRKEYGTCLDFSNFITTTFPSTDGLAEVYMIRGKAYGYMGQRDSLKSVYKYIKQNYPDSDVMPEVNRTLAMLEGGPLPDDNGGGSGQVKEGSTNGDDPRYSGFTMEMKPHEKLFVVMLINKEKIKSSDLQVKLNDFHKKYFQESRLNVSVFLYKNEYHMPYISQFDDFRGAMDYIKSAMKEPAIAELFAAPDEKMVVISPANFRTAYGKKRMEDYLAYYENVVLKTVNGN